MLDAFLSMLAVRHQRASLTAMVEGDQALLLEIGDKLKKFKENFRTRAGDQNDPAWNEAYQIERTLALVEPAQSLVQEIERRLGEAREEGLSCVDRIERALAGALATPADPLNRTDSSGPNEYLLRSILLDILEETHWVSQRKFYARPIRQSATKRIVLCGVLAFIMFVFPYAILYVKPNVVVTHNTLGWSWLPLYSVLTAGLFGALFSRLLYLQSNWDALTAGGLRDARDFTSIILRGSVGMTGSVIVYFFLQSGVISGGLFPKFDEIGILRASFPRADGTEPDTQFVLQLLYPSSSLALLVVWSFLSGFSERLVPSLLRDTEVSITRTSASGDRPKG
jgi:hypothetical protein